MKPVGSLPEAFASLAPFVERWALASEEARYRQLHSVEFEELKRFYEAMLPRMDSILETLDQHPLDELPPDIQTLFDLAMTFAETAHPLDLGWKTVDFPGALAWQRFDFRTVSAAAAPAVPIRHVRPPARKGSNG